MVLIYVLDLFPMVLSNQQIVNKLPAVIGKRGEGEVKCVVDP